MKNVSQKQLYYTLLGQMLLTFFLWFFKVDIYLSIGIFSCIMISQILFKMPLLTHVTLTLLGVFASYHVAEHVEVHHVLTGILFLYVIIRSGIQRSFVKGKFFIPLTLIALYALISIIWAPNFLDSVGGLGVIVQGYLWYVIVMNWPKESGYQSSHLSIFTSIFLWFGIVILIIAAQQAGQLAPFFKGVSMNYGFLFKSPNIVYAMHGLLLPFTLMKYQPKFGKKYLWFIPIDVMLYASLLLTGSRGLGLGIAVGVFVILLFLIKTPKKIFSIIVPLIGAMAICSIFVVLSLETTHPEIFNKINAISTHRFQIYKIAKQNIFKSLPAFLFGSGVRSSITHLTQNQLGIRYYHNFILHIMVTLGLVGMVLYSYLFVKIFKLFSFKTFYGRLLVISLMIFLGHQMVDVSFDLQYLGAIFYGLIAVYEKNNNWELSTYARTDRQ